MKTRVVVFLGVVAALSLFPEPAAAKWVSVGHFRGGAVKDFAVKDGALFVALAESGVFVSKDQGANWNTANAGLPAQAFVECLAASDKDVFLGTFKEGIFVSENNGGWWKASNAGLPQQTAIKDIVTNGTSILAATAAGVFLSTDRGASWNPMNQGLPTDLPASELVALGPGLFAAMNGAVDGTVFLSSDSGEAWVPVGGSLPGKARILCLTGLGSSVWVGTENHKVFRHAVDSPEWEAGGSGLPGTKIYCLLANGEDLFAGTGGAIIIRIGDNAKDRLSFAGHGTGIFYSGNRGRRWKAINSGLRRAPDVPELGKMYGFWVLELAVCGDFLFAGTYDGEIWRLPLSELPKK
jgi:hypothetical protein